MSRANRNPRTVTAGLAAALLLVAIARATGGEGPLTAEDLVRFLKVGISERTILAEVQGRGIAQALDPASETALREAGASETLVVAVRRAAPGGQPAADPPSVPSGRPGPGGHPVASFAARTRTVRVPVSVLDKSGRPVMGLRAEDFRISDDGKPLPVSLFSGERRALRIALALDVSGSMENKIRNVEAALRQFIQLLEPADEIMVITFNDQVHVIQDFTSDRGLLARALDMLQPVGSTSLYDAAAEAIRRVAPGPAESKAVVLVSDGVDTSSNTAFITLRELARRSEVPVFSIALDANRDLTGLRPPGPYGPIGRGPVFPGGPGRRPGRGGRGGWPGGGWPGGPSGGGPSGGPSGGGWPGTVPTALRGFDAEPLRELADETGGRAEIVKGLAHYQPGADGPEHEGI